MIPLAPLDAGHLRLLPALSQRSLRTEPISTNRAIPVIQEKSLAESYIDDITGIVASFEEKEANGKHSLEQLLTSDPQAFCAAAIRVLGRTKPSAGTRQVAELLAESKYSSAALLDPAVCSAAEAVAASKAVAETGKKIETALEIALGKALRGQTHTETSLHILRILNLLEAISAQGWWNSFQVELMAYPDKLVRSKAALLIGRATKNAAWIGRRLMDRDLRVQANAVEALWELDASESRPLLLTASKSKNNRVAGNAAVGLYRLGDTKVIRPLLEMARHKELLFRLSALWAIGETQDPRFLPFLTEQFKTADGKLRLAVTKALAQIRRREKATDELGTVQVHLADAAVQPGGRRRIVFALSKAGTGDLSKLKAIELAIWEGGVLVEDYELKSSNNPALLVTGFVIPAPRPGHDPHGDALLEGLKRCLARKRTGDLWRIDRYASSSVSSAPAPSDGLSAMPYDDTLVTEQIKSRCGFLGATEELEKILSLPVPPERTAPDPLNALVRQIDAAGKHAGQRHVVVLLSASSAELAARGSRLGRSEAVDPRQQHLPARHLSGRKRFLVWLPRCVLIQSRGQLPPNQYRPIAGNPGPDLPPAVEPL